MISHFYYTACFASVIFMITIKSNLFASTGGDAGPKPFEFRNAGFLEIVNDGKTGYCRAARIEKDFLVSAAHCVTKEYENADKTKSIKPADKISFILVDLATQKPLEKVEIKSFDWHSQYSGRGEVGDIDIAILQLAAPTEGIRPSNIVLPTADTMDLKKDEMLDLVTFVHPTENYMEVKTNTLKMKFRRTLGNSLGLFEIDEKGRKICRGDSGGSILRKKNDGKVELVAVASQINRTVPSAVYSKFFGDTMCENGNLKATLIKPNLEWIKGSMADLKAGYRPTERRIPQDGLSSGQQSPTANGIR